MAWSWSHSQEAYDAVYQQLLEKDREWLIVVYAEWRAYQKGRKDETDYEERFNESCYNRTVKWLKGDGASIDNDTLAEAIWEWASEYATCDNGGFNAWMCPYGCGCHEIPFTPPDEEEDDEDDDLYDALNN